MRSMGIKNRTKKMLKIANPLAARVYNAQEVSDARFCNVQCCGTYNDPVIPSKDSKLIQPGNKIPARSDVSSEEDAKCED